MRMVRTLTSESRVAVDVRFKLSSRLLGRKQKPVAVGEVGFVLLCGARVRLLAVFWCFFVRYSQWLWQVISADALSLPSAPCVFAPQAWAVFLAASTDMRVGFLLRMHPPKIWR